MTRPTSRLPMAMALLLLLAAALFATGVRVEHATKTSEPRHAATSATTNGSAESDQDRAANGENGEPATREGAPGHAETAAGERMLGVRADSAAAVTAMLIASVLLAAAVWLRPRRAILAATGAFAATAAVLDIAETVHQHTEGRTNILLIAAAVAVTHLAVVAVALAAISRRQPVALTPAS